MEQMTVQRLLVKLKRMEELLRISPPKSRETYVEQYNLEYELEKEGFYPFIDEYGQLCVQIGKMKWNR